MHVFTEVLLHMWKNCLSPFSSPEVRPTVDQVKDLSRVEELFEASQEFHSLVVTTFRIDKNQEGTGT